MFTIRNFILHDTLGLQNTVTLHLIFFSWSSYEIKIRKSRQNDEGNVNLFSQIEPVSDSDFLNANHRLISSSQFTPALPELKGLILTTSPTAEPTFFILF